MARFRVMVWGTGGVGALCIAEIMRNPELQLVGVRTYTAAKHGVDSGVIIGLSANGVPARNDPNVLGAVDCDCILYVPRDLGGNAHDAELLELLRSGRNVVTPLSFHDLPRRCGQGAAKRLAHACSVGGSSFHATGVNPDVVGGRLLLSLTGLCLDIDSIELRERWDCSGASRDTLLSFGFGLAPEVAARGSLSKRVSFDFLRATCSQVCAALDHPIGRIVVSRRFVTADHDFAIGHAHAPAGSVVGIVHRAVAQSRAGPPWRMVAESHWLALDTLCPSGFGPDEQWVIQIGGRPDVRLGLSLSSRAGASAALPGHADLLATAAACLQAIPHVVAAPPGIVPLVGPEIHWRRPPRS